MMHSMIFGLATFGRRFTFARLISALRFWSPARPHKSDGHVAESHVLLSSDYL
jgi:hypothetical protein